MSLSECTARSARPSSNAFSSSLTNRPFPPTFERLRSKISSPLVLSLSKSTCISGYKACNRACTCSACQSARRLARVAIVKRRGVTRGVSLAKIIENHSSNNSNNSQQQQALQDSLATLRRWGRRLAHERHPKIFKHPDLNTDSKKKPICSESRSVPNYLVLEI